MSRETVENAIGGYDEDAAMDLVIYGRVWLDGDGKRINPKDIYLEPDLAKCPKCKGPADNGHDRCLPPNPYYCTKCSAEPDDESAAVTHERGLLASAVGGGSIGLSGGETTAAVASPDIIELQRKADMADELAEALMPIAARGEISASIIHVAKAALAKYRGQS